MSTPTELDRLRLLLPHWIEHNAEHASEFREWAERARQAGQSEAGKAIVAAAEALDEANKALNKALRNL